MAEDAAHPAEHGGPDWLCEECDWIGSPDEAPVACPNCGHEHLTLMESADG